MMKTYTVVCGGFPLVTLKIEAESEQAALIQADALLKEQIQARVEPELTAAEQRFVERGTSVHENERRSVQL